MRPAAMRISFWLLTYFRTLSKKANALGSLDDCNEFIAIFRSSGLFVVFTTSISNGIPRHPAVTGAPKPRGAAPANRRRSQ